MFELEAFVTLCTPKWPVIRVNHFMSLECVRVLEAFLACLASEESFVGVNSFNVGFKSTLAAERFRALTASIPVAVFHMAFKPLSISKCCATQLTFVICWILHEELFGRIASTDPILKKVMERIL